jgi:hypothetical protein
VKNNAIEPIGQLLLVISGFIRFLWWQESPGLFPCLVFWVCLVCSWILLLIDSEHGSQFIRRSLGLVGLLMNAAATISNGGFMPVVGETHGRSLWVPATNEHSFLFFADYTEMYGASLGDLYLTAGIIAGSVYWLFARFIVSENPQEHQDYVPGSVF